MNQKARYDVRMRFLQVPNRYKDATIDDFSNELKKVIHNIGFVTGPPGVGKTHLLYALAQQEVRNSINHVTSFVKYNELRVDIIDAYYLSTSELMAKIRRTYDPLSEKTEDDIIRLCSTAKHLFLDDLGVSANTEWSLDIIYRIINYRWTNELRTVVSSNLSLLQIGDRIGQMIMSRIAGMGEVIELKGKDKRV